MWPPVADAGRALVFLSTTLGGPTTKTTSASYLMWDLAGSYNSTLECETFLTWLFYPWFLLSRFKNPNIWEILKCLLSGENEQRGLKLAGIPNRKIKRLKVLENTTRRFFWLDRDALRLLGLIPDIKMANVKIAANVAFPLDHESSERALAKGDFEGRHCGYRRY